VIENSPGNPLDDVNAKFVLQDDFAVSPHRRYSIVLGRNLAG